MTFPEERLAITNLLRLVPDPVCIVELGAHEGEDTAWMLNALAGRNSHAILVEADRVNYEVLLAEGFSASGTRTTAILGAIAGHNGLCTFWANRDRGGGYGSIYKPIPGQLSVDYSQFHQTLPVSCFTLDSLYLGQMRTLGLDHIDLLYVDIHGAEKDMITHGQAALERTRYLFIEATDTPMYEGAATSSELQGMLPGWKLLQVFPWNLLLKNEAYC